MTDRIEAKALALINEVSDQHNDAKSIYEVHRSADLRAALCRAIEQHEAFKQEVSDAIENAFSYCKDWDVHPSLWRFIIPKPKPDPIAEAWIEATGNTVGMEPLNAALEARGLEIRSRGAWEEAGQPWLWTYDAHLKGKTNGD